MTEPADGWIRVTPETMPKPLERIFYYGPRIGVVEGHLGLSNRLWYGRGRRSDARDASTRDVTHWQPLSVPAPPKETTHAR